VCEHEYANTTVDEFPMMQCEHCTSWYLDPRPAAEALETIYPPNYYAYVLEAREGSQTAAPKGLFGRASSLLVRRRMAPIARHLALSPSTRWLDVGCGSGVALETMRSICGAAGFGIDMSRRSVAICRSRGFEAEVCAFESFGAERGGSFDLIHSSHVIEHVPSPLEYMRKAYALLRPGGLNAFFTPNTDTWEARRLGRNWGGVHAPRHWAILNPKSCKRLAELTGFELVETNFSTNGVFWVWTFHALLQSRFGRSAADRLFPSDHRYVESGFVNVARMTACSGIDWLNTSLFRKSANMMAIYRKPLES
jgi:2-polyprenyl-3-methyl-5-hydroxy-6-metoxy-1,4-benzoquinol methylase